VNWILAAVVWISAGAGHLSPDGRCFLCGLVEEDGRELIYQWRRRSLKSKWKGPELLPGKINQVGDLAHNIQPSITADGLRMVFVRNYGELWQDNDLWIAVRESVKDPFDSVRSIAELNTDSSESYPFISADGGSLYYTTDEGIMVAEYEESFGRYREPDVLRVGSERPLCCRLSADELMILVTSYEGNVLLAERDSLSEPFMVVDTLSLPSGLGFISSPSLDPGGELYLYVSVPQEDSGEEGLDEENSVDMIIRLRCEGGK
jgi:hypothetical protein